MKTATKKSAKKKTAGRQFWQQTITVKGLSKACLKRIKELVDAECGAGGGVVAYSNPSPSCGGPGDPCPE